MDRKAISELRNIREAQRARGTASILAIGTATPDNCYDQSDFPDFYFRVTKCEHMAELKNKFKRICEGIATKKRYMYLSEDIIEKNPSLYDNEAPSLNLRHEMVDKEVPQLGKAAALEAIKEWGQPLSKITHLIFATSSGRAQCPSPDFHLAKLLGLDPSVRRHMLYYQGCFTAGAALRLAKGVAENNVGARVCRKLPWYVGSCVEKALEEAFAPLGISDLNSLFYVVHPGGRAVLDQVEERLGLGPEKLRASRHVYQEYHT